MEKKKGLKLFFLFLSVVCVYVYLYISRYITDLVATFCFFKPWVKNLCNRISFSFWFLLCQMILVHCKCEQILSHEAGVLIENYQKIPVLLPCQFIFQIVLVVLLLATFLCTLDLLFWHFHACFVHLQDIYPNILQLLCFFVSCENPGIVSNQLILFL